MASGKGCSFLGGTRLGGHHAFRAKNLRRWVSNAILSFRFGYGHTHIRPSWQGQLDYQTIAAIIPIQQQGNWQW
jgi:hypothetical protein